MLDKLGDHSFFTEFTAALRDPSPAHEPGMIVYRNNSRSAFLRVLEETFPVVLKLVGSEFFRYLAHEYYLAHPASSPWVHLYGRAMPAFLEGFEPARDLPYLPDIARLELLWLESYHAAEALPLAPLELQQKLGAENALGARLTLHPSLRWLKSPFPVATLWHHNKASEGAIKLEKAQENILLMRPETGVLVRVVPADVLKAVAGLKQGKTLEASVVEGTERDPEEHLTNLLQTLIENQLVISVETTK